MVEGADGMVKVLTVRVVRVEVVCVVFAHGRIVEENTAVVT